MHEHHAAGLSVWPTTIVIGVGLLLLLVAYLAAVRSAWRSTLHWLRQGQLRGYPGVCSTC